MVLSIKHGFYKIKKSIFRLNYARYVKNIILESKTVHLKKIYKFCFDYFLIKRTVLVLIEKMLLKIKKARYEKMLRSKIVYLKKIYKFDFDHFFMKMHSF